MSYYPLFSEDVVIDIDDAQTETVPTPVPGSPEEAKAEVEIRETDEIEDAVESVSIEKDVAEFRSKITSYRISADQINQNMNMLQSALQVIKVDGMSQSVAMFLNGQHQLDFLCKRTLPTYECFNSVGSYNSDTAVYEEAISEKIAEYKDKIKSFFSATVSAVSNLLDKAREKFPKLFAFFDSVKAKVQPTIDLIKNNAKAMVEWVKFKYRCVTAKAAEFFEKYILPAFNKLIGIFSKDPTPETVKEVQAISQQLDAAGKKELGEKDQKPSTMTMTEAGYDSPTDLPKANLADKAKQIMEKLTSMKDKIVSWFKKAKETETVTTEAIDDTDMDQYNRMFGKSLLGWVAWILVTGIAINFIYYHLIGMFVTGIVAIFGMTGAALAAAGAASSVGGIAALITFWKAAVTRYRLLKQDDEASA